MKPKYQIFISSTFQDLREERRVLMEQILNLGHIPVGMEQFQAANRKQWDYITRRILECDYLLLIVAERYGSVHESGKSYTQKEYEFALERGIPAAAFLLEDAARRARPADHVEHGRKEEIESFRTLCSNQMVKYWSDPKNLALSATAALTELFDSTPRPGLIRPDAALMAQLEIDPNLPQSRTVSEALSKALGRDLRLTGYFRENQCLHFVVSNNENGLIVKLRFTASIIPLRSDVKVFRPIVEPPANAEMISCVYKVNGVDVSGSDSYDVSEKADDELTVCYKLLDPAVVIFSDDHFWPSPVLDYTVRFEQSNLFSLEVGKITGRKTDKLKPADPRNQQPYVEFKSKAAAFTAQGIRWNLKRRQISNMETKNV